MNRYLVPGAILDSQNLWLAQQTFADDILLRFGNDGDIVLLNRSTALGADEELAGVIEGTSDHQGVAANSLILSNITNDGDIIMLVSDGGNSLEFLLADADVAFLHLGFGMLNTNIYASGDITIASSAGSLNVTLQAAGAVAYEAASSVSSYYIIDTQVATSGRRAHVFDNADIAFANIPTSSFTQVRLSGYVLNVTGDADDITGTFPLMLDVNSTVMTSATASTNYTGVVSSVRVQGPSASTNVILDQMAAIHVRNTADAAGESAVQSGLQIDTLDGGTLNFMLSLGSSDVDHNLLRVGNPSSGNPIFGWNHSEDKFSINKGLILTAGRLSQNQGADVASTNNLVLGADGNTFEITGTTDINLLSNIGWQNGSTIRLLFTSTATVKDAQATSTTNITILLDGSADFVPSAGDTLQLTLCEIGGTQAWRETGSRNVL